MNDVQMMMWRWGDRAWWVIESVFLRSPDKGFWACLGDIPPDMPRRSETWVSLYNLMMKLCGISRSSAILGSDSPQSNNRKDHSRNASKAEYITGRYNSDTRYSMYITDWYQRVVCATSQSSTYDLLLPRWWRCLHRSLWSTRSGQYIRQRLRDDPDSMANKHETLSHCCFIVGPTS